MFIVTLFKREIDDPVLPDKLKFVQREVALLLIEPHRMRYGSFEHVIYMSELDKCYYEHIDLGLATSVIKRNVLSVVDL